MLYYYVYKYDMVFLVDSAVAAAKVNRQSLHSNEAKHSTQWRRVITACMAFLQ